MPETLAIEPWSVQQVISKLPKTITSVNPESPVAFFHILELLKTTKREGWRRFGITSGESISDHMYRMSIITMLAPPPLRARLDLSRCTNMALIHDMAEALVGDITPVDNVPKVEKSRRERTTMEYFTGTLLGGVKGGAGKQILEIWEEYEAGETLEAKFVHDVDKVELVLQMTEYERARKGKLNLSEFSWVSKRIELPEVQEWCTEILKERDAFWSSLGSKVNSEEASAVAEEQMNEYCSNKVS
jgi:putative hydrolase of HD superfamily